MDEKRIPPPPPPDKVIRVQQPKMNLTYGKVPPQAIDLEIAVIGGLLIDGRAAGEIMDWMIPEVFFKMEHSTIFEAIQTIHNKSSPIDLLTIAEELRRTGKLTLAGGEYNMIEITQKISSAAHIEVHARILMQKYILRELIKLSEQTTGDAFENDPDVFMLMERITADIDRINTVAISNSKQVQVLDPKEDLRKRVKDGREGITPGIYIGVSEFDNATGGLPQRELISIAARPGVGKTTVGLAMSATIGINREVRCAFYSLEMAKIDLLNRLAARLTGIAFQKIRKAELSDAELEKVSAALDFLETCKLHIYDTSEHKNKLENIVASIRKEVREGARVVFIDYLQIVQLMVTRGTETADLNKITGTLKALANELNIPIVAFAQLGREVDKRAGHIPLLADLKQSGSIEQDSDTVIFIVREAYYKQMESSIPLPQHIAGDVNFMVAKGRSIGVAQFRTYMDFHKYTFNSYSDNDF